MDKLVAMHDFLLQNNSADNEIRAFEELTRDIGLVRTIYFMYHFYLVSDLCIVTEAAMRQTQEEEQQLASYIDEMYAYVDIEVYSDPFERDTSENASFRCNKCFKSYASRDGVRRHYRKQHVLK